MSPYMTEEGDERRMKNTRKSHFFAQPFKHEAETMLACAGKYAPA
jgi:hypothetical protein